MKNTRQLMRRAQELFRVDYLPFSVNKANRKKWVRAVIQLGPKWKLHPDNHVGRMQ